MSKKILIVYAQPEPRSLVRHLVDTAVAALEAEGHSVMLSDLYGMGWKAVYDAADFPDRADPERLDFMTESSRAYTGGTQPPDIAAEQEKVLAADAVILAFPLWWFGLPAILKGWIDRVWAYGFAYGVKGAGNRYRYGEGNLVGRRALLAVTTGGPAEDYSPRGVNGPLEQLLFPVTHGMLFYPGMAVLPIHALYGTVRITPEGVEAAKEAWRARLKNLFDEAPIPFRSQNGGDYPNRHTLADDIAPGQSGILAHIASGR